MSCTLTLPSSGGSSCMVLFSTMWKLSFLLLCVSVASADDLNQKPIIGILAQRPEDSVLEKLGNYTSFIDASFVKFIESAGGRVVPVLTYQEPEYYQTIVESVNGILFPGGDVSITNSSGYGMGAQLMFEVALRRNLEGTYLPVWGTCLGLEVLMYLEADMKDWLTSCSSENEARALIFEEGFWQSRMFAEVPGDVLEALWYEPITINFHDWCLTRENFTASGLADKFLILTTNRDFKGLEFLSTVEHKFLPFFAVQWHPEKNVFEWISNAHHNIPHSPSAVKAGQYFSNFLVNQARRNFQKFASSEEEQSHLIYNYEPTDVRGFSSYTQIYLFR